MDRQYRQLTEIEISVLEQNGCLCRDWRLVDVATDGFDAKNLQNVRLAGSVKLGANSTQPSGIYNARIADCAIGDNVLISNVGIGINNYDIGDNVHIENAGSIAYDGAGNFGNGVEVRAINEAGGREVIIFNTLSAQFAYMMAMYRSRPKLVEKLRETAIAECAKVTANRAKIDNAASVKNCGKLLNVNIGENAIIEGVSILSNGSVNSSKIRPAFIGADVKAYDFITSSNSRVDNGAILKRCFVGEGCRIDDGFTATDCLFFANSDLGAGEACSVFGGPFTVSHHKSSLLIAGYFLFFNAGSGANQSNHLFKTGSVHQGIHERGCKFGSNAYVMLPAREGAFNLVIGRHSSHHDTSDLPYSYLIEEDGRSYLMPGFNLRSSGTARDIAKWPNRDEAGCEGRDRISYAEHNPYIGGKLLKAIDICNSLLEKKDCDTHTFNRVRIKTVLVKRGLALYNTALDALIGSLLNNKSDATGGMGNWVDMAGMFAPQSEIEIILGKIEKGELAGAGDIEAGLTRINKAYESYAYMWALAALEKLLGHKPSQADVDEAIYKGNKAAESLAEMRREDAVRDNDNVMRTSYGIDGHSADDINADFLAVRKSQRK